MIIIRQITLVALMVFTSYAAQDAHKPQERRVRKETVGVDFTCHSRVDKVSDHQFTLNHFIKNHSSSPLSVEWKEAGIICVGASQLPPGYTDSGSSGRVVHAPTIKDSDIRYGVKLNYSSPAQVYIDPQRTSANKKIIETTYERKNEENEPVFSIQVISELKEDQSAELTFRIYGGFSLLIAADGPRRQPTTGLISGFVEPPAFGFSDASVDNAMRRWFSSRDGDRFLVLKNPTPETIEVVTVFKRGTSMGDLKVKEIHLVAFDPKAKGDGFVGLTALAYIPANLPLK